MKVRNFVAKNMNGKGGAHTPKKGVRAPRCRQKKQWKKIIQLYS